MNPESQIIIKADRMAEMLQKLYVIFEQEGKESPLSEYRAQCAFICVEIDARVQEYRKEKEAMQL